jgi:hypothetical protein
MKILRLFDVLLDLLAGDPVLSRPTCGSKQRTGGEMTDVAMKVKVGVAACAVAASASLIPITTAAAAPAPAPLAPVQVTYAPEAPFIFGSGKPFSLLDFLNQGLPSGPSTASLTPTTTTSWTGVPFFKLFVGKLLSHICGYHGVV